MTENGNGNTLKYRMDQCEEKLNKYIDDQKDQYINIIQPFLNATNETVSFVNDNKKLIKELKTMQTDIDYIKKARQEDKKDRKDDRRSRRNQAYAVVGAVIASIIVQYLIRSL